MELAGVSRRPKEQVTRILRTLRAIETRSIRNIRLSLPRASRVLRRDVIEEIAKMVAKAGTRFSSHNWRSVASGVSGGWSVARCLFMLNALLGAIATEGGVYPNAWNKFVPRPIYTPPHPKMWNETTWPREYPLSMNEMSFLLPHLFKDGRAKLDVYFTRVYNPVWTNPDGFSWIEMLTIRIWSAVTSHSRPRGMKRLTTLTTFCRWASARNVTIFILTRLTMRSGLASANP